MNEIGLSSNMPSTGATRAYTSPRVDSGSEGTPATPNVTTSTPNSGSNSTPPTQTVGSSRETISISPEALRLQQAGASTTGTVESRSDSGLDSGQAMAMAQTARETMAQNPQLAFQAQTGRISAQQVASVLRV
ncbi:hypothetical protein [Allochromatium tepidum]|uniref:Negative regulator of flagellin synthesis n=1 Tax=Allochromatium tepidum TaxID=553982 RepID=A0ABN6G5S2_9GAMM|nr:hypothetical protein [Allochromatium tepidum]BCU05354.1 hypothetical protein Atep_00310 [Allochromatium tepidum]